MADKDNTFNSGPSSVDEIADAAASWLARRDRGLSAAEEREFAAWRAANPHHDEEFSRLDSEWHGFDLAKADPELVAMAQVLDDRTRARPARHRRRAWLYAFTVAAAAAIPSDITSVRFSRSNMITRMEIAYQRLPKNPVSKRLALWNIWPQDFLPTTMRNVGV